MEQKEINPIVGIAVAVVVLGLAIFFGFRAAQPPTPRPGSYTPGVPPWMEKNKAAPTPGGVHMPPGPGNAAVTH